MTSGKVGGGPWGCYYYYYSSLPYCKLLAVYEVTAAPRVFAAIYFVDSRFITRNIEMITYSLSNVLDNQSQET